MKKTKLTEALLEGLYFSEMIFKEESGYRFVEYVGEVERLSTVKQLALFFNADTTTDTVLEVKKLLKNKEVEICFDDEHLHLTFNNFLFTERDTEWFEGHHDLVDLTIKKVNHKKQVFDCLYTADGHEIFWLHDYTQKSIEYPDSELYLDRYTFYEVCEKLIKEGAEFDNYVFEEEEIKEMQSYLESI